MVFINIKVIQDYGPVILSGIGNTLILTFGGFGMGLVFGALLAFAQCFGRGIVRRVATAIEESLRSIPLLVLMLLIFFGLPELGISLSPVQSAILAIGLRSMAYQSQILRSAISAIPYGQVEAALSLGMTKAQLFSTLIAPQAFRIALPGLVNQFTIDLKDTSIAYAIGVSELFTQSIHVAQVTLNYLTPLLFVGSIYFVMTFSTSTIANYLYRKFSIPGLGEASHG